MSELECDAKVNSECVCSSFIPFQVTFSRLALGGKPLAVFGADGSRYSTRPAPAGSVVST